MKKIKVYINDLNIFVKNNFNELMKFLKKRFSEKKKRDKRKKIMNSLFKFKQRERRLQKYFKKIKYLKQNLKNLEFNIIKRMIKSLNNNITRKIMRSTLTVKFKLTIKKMIKIIQNAEKEKIIINEIKLINHDTFQAIVSKKLFIKFMK